jgi:arginase family enzyme
MTLGLDPLEELRVVDYGDVEAAPADLQHSHQQLRKRLREILAAGAMPLVLGGDHSLSLPTLQMLAERFGPEGYAVLQLDTHADTAESLYGVRISHGPPFDHANVTALAAERAALEILAGTAARRSAAAPEQRSHQPAEGEHKGS